MNQKTKALIVLIVLYLGFISLGLPDQILGITWSAIRNSFEKPIAYAGLLLFITTIFTSISSFASGYLTKHFSIVFLLCTSAFLTALGIVGYGLSPSWEVMILCTVPLGFGAGTIDSVLNDYVAKNYSSRHMNWLHGCWGIGATLGTAIATFAIALTSNWRIAYFIIAGLQTFLLLLFMATSSLWNKEQKTCENEPLVKQKTSVKMLSLAPFLSCLFYFFYTGLEVCIGLWLFSFMTIGRGVSEVVAGSWIVLYWGSLTVGRFLIGIISNKIGTSLIITYSILGALSGLCLFFFDSAIVTPIGMILVGLSLAPIYPCMMFETAIRFDADTARVLTGYQVGSANLGLAFLPPFVGLLIERTHTSILLPILFFLGFSLLIIDLILNKKCSKESRP